MGTIHSLAYRTISSPPLAVAKEAVELWNAKAPDAWRLTPRVRGRGEAALDALNPYEENEAPPGDRLYDAVNHLRNALVPVERWPEEARRFYYAWKAFMSQEEVIDFPGMLEQALVRPGLGVSYLLVDEAQDLTPLQLALVEHWAASTQYFALIGDDDQSIYSFMGANGEAFLRARVSEELVLDQSYRVPARVQAFAQAVISRVSTRAQKHYRPREEKGNVRLISEGPRSPYYTVEDALGKVKQGKSVLFLATAGFMLNGLKDELLRRGVPYGNPYAPHRPSFNLFPLSQNGLPAWERARAFLYPKRKMKDLKAWTRFVRAEVFAGPATKARERINSLPDEQDLLDNHPIWDVLHPSHRAYAINRDPAWLLGNLIGTAPKGMREALQVAVRSPEAVLQAKPKVWLGTIHSVKGGEADVVYVWPGYTSKAARESMDNLHRLFYVAATRAREELVLLGEGVTPYAYYWPLEVLRSTTPD
jgi:hypothetical protein